MTKTISNNKKTKANVFIFRRDLRVSDNTALSLLFERHPGVPILPIFIFNPYQVSPELNEYHNETIIEFMIECLQSLDIQLDGYLQCFHGNDEDVLKMIDKQIDIHTVAWNEDFTPFSKKRDALLLEYLKSHGKEYICTNDYTLFNFEIMADTKKPYEVYTPFYRKCMQNIKKIPKVKHLDTKMLCIYKQSITKRVKNISKNISNHNTSKALVGGRDMALHIIDKIHNGEFRDYEKYRDFPALDKTTKMSSYLKFGCISIRECFESCMKAYGLNHGLVRELLWREFYANITHYFPHILLKQIEKGDLNMPLKSKYNSISWKYNDEYFKAWCEGRTGFPFIDAAMICMNKTGFMHNRLRMIVASFLSKDLLQDWRLGEKYFAQKLIDYDPSSNSGGWQWASSVGADAQPYFRIFNPWLQSDKFDKDCVFIKKWLPILNKVPSKHIHSWYKYHVLYKNEKYNINYPNPIVDHSKVVQEAKKLYAHL